MRVLGIEEWKSYGVDKNLIYSISRTRSTYVTA